MFARFVDMVAPVKTQIENGLSKIFDFRGKTIDVSDQYVLTLKDFSLHNIEDKKPNIRNQFIVGQRKSGNFLLFTMMVNPYQAD